MSTDSDSPRELPAFVEVNDSNFDAEVLQSVTPVIVLFSAPWEQNTRAYVPVIRKVAGRLSSPPKLAYVNVDETPSTPTKYKVRQIPLLMIFADGGKKAEFVGALEEDHLYFEVTGVLPK